ncbi:MAG: hypothetical protein MJ252_13960 [archaeon]|nr:hypothetical protein [archaeon]
MSSLFSYIKSSYYLLDLFSMKPYLFVNSKYSYSTKVGFVCSIIVAMVYLGFFIFFVNMLLSREHFTAFTTIISPDEVIQNKNFTPDNFYFTIGVEDPITYEYILDDSIFTIEGSYITSTTEDDGSFTKGFYPLDLVRCSEIKDDTEIVRQMFYKKTIDNLLCVRNLNHNIQGTFVDREYNFFLFKLFVCKNTTENGNKCKSQETINYYFKKGTFFQVEFTNSLVDFNNFEQPVAQGNGEVYTYINLDSFTEIHEFLRIVEFRNDKSFFFGEIEKSRYVKQDHSNVMKGGPSDDNQILAFQWKMAPDIEVHTREYMKIFDVGSYLSAVIAVVSNVTPIIGVIYVKSAYENSIIEEIFKIKPDNKKGSNISFKDNTSSHFEFNSNKGMAGSNYKMQRKPYLNSEMNMYNKSSLQNDKFYKGMKRCLNGENKPIENKKEASNFSFQRQEEKTPKLNLSQNKIKRKGSLELSNNNRKEIEDNLTPNEENFQKKSVNVNDVESCQKIIQRNQNNIIEKMNKGGINEGEEIFKYNDNFELGRKSIYSKVSKRKNNKMLECHNKKELMNIRRNIFISVFNPVNLTKKSLLLTKIEERINNE